MGRGGHDLAVTDGRGRVHNLPAGYVHDRRV